LHPLQFKSHIPNFHHKTKQNKAITIHGYYFTNWNRINSCYFHNKFKKIEVLYLTILIG
jgi:hypothetical protein